MKRRLWSHAAAVLLAMIVAGSLYGSTLLPGFDLGDTASFQTLVGSDVLTPRAAYPLYFALGRTFVWLSGSQSGPARTLNVMSAIFGTLSVGLMCWIGIRLSRSAVAGLVAGLMLAGSYTFWSQSVIAEVYTLHVSLTAACLLSLLWWAQRPSTGRLTLFFALYALGFGNHLSTILLAPGFMLFVAMTMPGGLRRVFAPQVVALALAMAFLGSLQYAWNVHGLQVEDGHARGLLETARIFWFDTTKSDWRESLVGGVPASRIAERFGMYWFEVHQQFGVLGATLAVLGFGRLLSLSRPIALMLLVHFLVTAGFAFGYNVGDSHVFFLTSHAILALLMAPGAELPCRPATWQRLTPAIARTAPRVAAIALVAYPVARIADTYPAVDRSDDHRPAELLDALTRGIAVERAILGTHLDWQTQNGLSYYARYERPEVAWCRIVDVLPHFPSLVRANRSIGRAVVLTPDAADQVRAAYGDLFAVQRDPAAVTPSLDERLAGLRAGDAYVLALLESLAEWPLDAGAVDRAAIRLSGTAMPKGRYSILAGVAGRPPARISSDRPFRRQVPAGELSLDIRIESWIPFDTIRRAGYGQVIVNGHKVLTLERGLSFVGLTPAGRVKTSGYEGGLYAPPRREIIEAEHVLKRETE
jgi:hypothetical protein